MNVYGMAGHLIRRLNQISTHVFSTRMQAAGFDLTPVQFAAMDAIVTHPGIDQAGVAVRIAYDRATIGGVIDRLEQKGLVIRTVCRRDRRAREVRPTGDGVALFEKALPEVAALQVEILAGLDPAEQAVFARLAAKVIAHVADGAPGEPNQVGSSTS